MIPATERQCVLITGIGGFTGRHLAAYLSALNPAPRLIGFDLAETPVGGMDEHIAGNLDDFDTIAHVLESHRPDTIIHLAGLMPPSPSTALWSVNVGGTMTLLEALRTRHPTARLLVIGSAAEYGPTTVERVDENHSCQPSTPYGLTKLAQTVLCLSYHERFDLPIMIARPFNLFGPGMAPQTVIGETCSQIAQTEPGGTIQLGNLDSARDFIDIRDAVRAYWTVAQRGKPGEIYNICGGSAISIREMVEMAIQVSGHSYNVQSQSERFQAGDVRHSRGDCRKLIDLHGGDHIRDLAESLRDTLASFRKD